MCRFGSTLGPMLTDIACELSQSICFKLLRDLAAHGRCQSRSSQCESPSDTTCSARSSSESSETLAKRTILDKTRTHDISIGLSYTRSCLQRLDMADEKQGDSTSMLPRRDHSSAVSSTPPIYNESSELKTPSDSSRGGSHSSTLTSVGSFSRPVATCGDMRLRAHVNSERPHSSSGVLSPVIVSTSSSGKDSTHGGMVYKSTKPPMPESMFLVLHPIPLFHPRTETVSNRSTTIFRHLGSQSASTAPHVKHEAPLGAHGEGQLKFEISRQSDQQDQLRSSESRSASLTTARCSSRVSSQSSRSVSVAQKVNGRWRPATLGMLLSILLCAKL